MAILLGGKFRPFPFLGVSEKRERFAKGKCNRVGHHCEKQGPLLLPYVHSNCELSFRCVLSHQPYNSILFKVRMSNEAKWSSHRSDKPPHDSSTCTLLLLYTELIPEGPFISHEQDSTFLCATNIRHHRPRPKSVWRHWRPGAHARMQQTSL